MTTAGTAQDELDHVHAALSEALARDQLVLPTLPEIALQVRDAASNPNVSIGELSDLAGRDPALSARLIKVANSSLVRSGQTVENLPSAISRLGITYSCSLAMGLAMEQMFQSTSAPIDRRMRRVWSHSTEVAAISSVLAGHYTELRADQAALAGLVHQIGILPILSYVEEHELYQDESQAPHLDALIARLHPRIGELILRTWNFPDPLVIVPSQHCLLNRHGRVADYADVVIVAKLQGGSTADLAYSPQFSNADWSTVSAFSRLGLDSTRDELVAEELTEEVSATRNAFQSEI